MYIGKMIRDRRKKLGLTLQEVGNFVGVGKSTVKKWEDGDIVNMKLDKIALLSKILKLDPVTFITGEKLPQENKPAQQPQETLVQSQIYGNRIRQARISCGLSQEALAQLLGSSKQVISRYELGTSLPRLDYAVKLAKFLHVPIDYLAYGYTEEDEAQKLGDETGLAEQIRVKYGEQSGQLLEAYKTLNKAGKEGALAAVLKIAELQRYKKASSAKRTIECRTVAYGGQVKRFQIDEDKSKEVSKLIKKINSGKN